MAAKAAIGLKGLMLQAVLKVLVLLLQALKSVIEPIPDCVY